MPARRALARVAFVFALALVLGLAACAPAVTVGRPFDTARMRNIRKNVDKEAEVMDLLGAPAAAESLVGSEPCVIRFRYHYAEPSESKVLFVDFDRRGVVCALTYACSGVCSASAAPPYAAGQE